MTNLQFDKSNAEGLQASIRTIINAFNEIKNDFKNNVVPSYENINALTKEKIGSMDFNPMISLLASIYSNLFEAECIVKSQISKMEGINSESSSVDTAVISTLGSTTGGSSSSSSGSSSEVTDVPVTEIITNENSVIPSLTIASTIGTLVFKEIVTLYETIGAPTGTPSNINGNYLVLGIIKSEDKRYYKIIDKDTNKIYYVEINENIEFQTQMENVLDVKDNTMILNSAEVGANNFVKLADKNTMYVVLNETENDNITFCNVLDPVDGNAYYIPVSDEVEKVSINSLVGISNNNSSEVII